MIEYVKLGRTGVKVSNLCIGTDNYGNKYGCEEQTAHKILGIALDSGINFIDTADSYNEGRSEQIIGNYLKSTGRRDQVVLATKCRSRVGKGPNDVGTSRYHVIRACEASLRRLQTDRIDLYYIHAYDYTTPIDETVAALDQLVRQGKVTYVGCSNFAAWQLANGLRVSDLRNMARFDVIQSVFNIVQPGLAREVIPLAIEEGVAVVPYSPLASGFLTGKHPRTAPLDDSKLGMRDAERGGILRNRYYQTARLDAVDRLKSVAERYGVTTVQLALHWVRTQPGITAPIFGARRVEQVESILKEWSSAPPAEAIAEASAVAADFAASSPMDYPPLPSPM